MRTNQHGLYACVCACVRACVQGFFTDKAADAAARGVKLPGAKDKEREFQEFTRALEDDLNQQVGQGTALPLQCVVGSGVGVAVLCLIHTAIPRRGGEGPPAW